MQASKFPKGREIPGMDEFGKKLWQPISRWIGRTGEMNAKEVLALRLGMSTKTLKERFKNHLQWSLWELKQVYELTQDAEVLQLIDEYVRTK